MKESAQIALSYVRSRRDLLGVDKELSDKRIHVHVPAGAIPKDGPSAGVAMVTAITSLLTRPAGPEHGRDDGRGDHCRGRCFRSAASSRRCSPRTAPASKEVILPKRNEADLDDLPQTVRDEMRFHLASDVKEVLEIALEPRVAVAEEPLSVVS